MDKENISKVDAGILYLKAKDKLVEISDKKKINSFQRNHELENLKKFFDQCIYDNPVPFNDKEFFIDLFNYYLLYNFSVFDFGILYYELVTIFDELDISCIDSEYCFKVISLIMIRDRSSGVTSFGKTYALKLEHLFNNKKYLLYLLSYILKNIRIFGDIGFGETINMMEEFKSHIMDELEFYKVCIYIINELKEIKDKEDIDNYIKKLKR